MVETQSQRNGVNTNRRYSYLKDKLQNGLSLFIKHESFGGVLLAVCVLFAMLIANSSYKEVYFWLQKFELGISLGNFEPKIELVHFVNDVLMSFFFLLVGLEMKREVLYGELAGFKKVSFSVLAAIGGIIAPIVLYLQFTSGTPYEKGFGIAMSTDTAFALGVILMLGERVPKIVKIFLVTLAVADDLGAISVIAIFYSQHIDMFWVYLALVIVGLLGYCNYRDTKYISIYFLLGIVLWVCILFSGIHVTIAAVILAFTIPGRTRVNRKYFANMLGEFERIKRVTNDGADITNIQDREKMGFWKSTWVNIKSFMTSSPSARNVNMAKASELVYMLDSIGTYSRYAQNPLLRIEHALQPICAYFIVPIFAFMNAGVSIDSHIELALDGVILGTIFGLVIGKPIGIFLFAFLGEKLKLSVRPDGLSNFHIIAVGAISGVGFTMSIFVANLAYKDNMSAIDLSKISILIASSIAVILGIVLMAIATRNNKNEQKENETLSQPSLF